jgi:transcriptional regulator with XRE-family HTH domain
MMANIYKEAFAAKIMALREQLGLTQQKLGQKVGVSGTCVWNWENANTYPRPATLSRLASALGTTVAHLNGNDQENETLHRNSKSRESVEGSTLSDIVEDARRRIARAAGVPICNVRVTLDIGS